MTKTILFQGDSITDCGRARLEITDPGYSRTGLGPGYPYLIAARLLCDRGRDFQFYNFGISGNRIVDLYARWKADCINLRPDILSILIGVNDTWHEKARRNGVEVPRYEQFYRMLMDWTLKELPDIGIVLLEPFVLPFGAVGEDWLDEIAQRGEVVRRIANDYHAVFVPLQSVLNNALNVAPQEHWLADGVHPMPAGHQLIADAWLKAAAPLLQ